MSDNPPVIMPKARKDQLIVRDLPDETLVYDRVSDEAHCLNDTAAKVWKYCDGEKSVSEISASLTVDSGVEVNERVVWLALDQLEERKLLEQVPPPPSEMQAMGRRQLMRTIGIAAVALPLIVSMIAPTPAEAASCNDPTGRPTNCDCTSSAQCANSCCRQVTGKCQANPPCLP